jgi:hypothetical protein
MFNLEQAIGKWREQMRANGMGSPEPLEELESHLRENIRKLRLSGASDREAFRMALSQMGEVSRVSAEFKKLNRGLSIPGLVGFVLWGGASVTLLVYCLGKLFAGKMTLLLGAHIFSLTAGYGAAVLAGGLGLGWGCGRQFDLFSIASQQEMLRMVKVFNGLATGFVLFGFILGTFWTQQKLGRFWINDPRAVGCLVAAVWLVSAWVIQKLHRTSDAGIILSSVLSNTVIALAWFGPQMGYRVFAFWPVDIFVGVHLVAGLIGMIQLFKRPGQKYVCEDSLRDS